jgi:1-acyl-sn-glycerol-3-phosphate acyltransferase
MLKKIKDSLISFAIYVVGGTCFGLWAVLLIIVSLFYTGSFFDRLLKWACRSILFCCGIHVTLKGTENFDPGKQYILMMNHVNLFDAFAAYARLPGKARAVEEESHFKWPLYGLLMRRIGMIPISRKSGMKAMNALKKAAELIQKRSEFSFFVLPEGTRTRTGKLGTFKKGGFLLAMESGLDILPMIQIGSFKIKQKLSRTIRPGKVEMVIEKPISTAGYTKNNIDDLIQKTRNVFLQYVP